MLTAKFFSSSNNKYQEASWLQEDPALRPSMKSVILMLEGTMNIPVPPSPVLPVLI